MENSSFVQVMKDWRRMCKAFTTDDDSCCCGCPVVDLHEHGCEAIFEMEDSTDWERYEGQIREWAAEHPEPVYPTWAEFLERFGFTPGALMLPGVCCGVDCDAERRNIWLMTTHIPADIAEKLGLGPKEDIC